MIDYEQNLNEINWNKQKKQNSFIRARIDDLIYTINKINLKIIIFYFTGFYIYLYSLTPIEGVTMTCFKRNGVECYYLLAILIFISSSFISISIFIIIHLKYSKIHLLIICAIIYLIII